MGDKFISTDLLTAAAELAANTPELAYVPVWLAFLVAGLAAFLSPLLVAYLVAGLGMLYGLIVFAQPFTNEALLSGVLLGLLGGVAISFARVGPRAFEALGPPNPLR